MNSASRIFAVLEHFAQWQQNKTMMAGWLAYLGLDGGPEGEHEVLLAIVALQQEIQNVQRIMRTELDAPVELFDVVAVRVRDGMSPVQLNNNWGGVAGSVIAGEVMASARWASWVLSTRYTEEEIDQATLDLLRKRVEDSEQFVASTVLPLNIRDLLVRQNRALRNALALYKIRGRAAVDAAVNETIGDLATMSEAVVEEVQSPAGRSGMQRLRDTLAASGRVARKAIVVVKDGVEVVEVVGKAWEKIQPLLEAAKQAGN